MDSLFTTNLTGGVKEPLSDSIEWDDQVRISMTPRIQVYWWSFVLLVLSMPIAQAHGDNASTVSNSAVIFISSISSIFVWSAGSEWVRKNSSIGSPLVFCLAIFSGFVHILLGLDDIILMVGGIGVFGILVASLVPILNRFEMQLKLGLAFVVSMMFIGYFVTNHDLHYIIEDYLGIITKLAELVMLQQLLTNADILLSEATIPDDSGD
jgi:hypothetical protein